MTGSATPTETSERVPTVLAVLVVRDAAGRLGETLSAIAAQTYPRLGVVAVDNASRDGSKAMLVEALGDGRVRSMPGDVGFGGAIAEVLRQPGADRPDFLLFMHDDAVLDPDAVARLVEAAIGIRGVSDVGIVGGKIVDDVDPRVLVDVGRSADRFGHADSPLQDDEIDQGQFDRVLEVLGVHGSAMLVSRDAWQRTGSFDERLDPEHTDLDFCWRARLAGFRVLMTPLARIRHPGTIARRDRSGRIGRSARYEEDRAALAAMLKNDSAFSLLRLLPLAFILTLVRLGYLLLSRRFEEALDVVAAWAWNLTHLPGTITRRRRVQKARRVKDRALRRFTDPSGLRLPRWFQTAERILEEQRDLDAEEEGSRATSRIRHRTASLMSTHPVIVASFLGVVVGVLATRHLLEPDVLAGGILPSFPDRTARLFGELVSATRSTGLGGSLPASPALGALGVVSWMTLGSTALAQKAVLAAGPALAAIIAYRATVRITGRPGPSVVAASSYGLSGIVLWSFSRGSISGLVTLATLPALIERLEVAFGPEEPADGRWRFVAGLGVTLAVAVAFEPGVVLAVAVGTIVQVLLGSARARGLTLIGVAVVVAAILLFPFVPTLVAGGASALGSGTFARGSAEIGKLTLGGGPGTWFAAWFLPVAAIVGFGLVRNEHRRRAMRALSMSVAAVCLAWLTALGALPGSLANAPVYLALAAVGEAMLVAYGLSSVLTGIGREAFGIRQIATVVLTSVLTAGITLQALASMIGGWSVGSPARVPAAWAVVAGAAQDGFRVLWVGSDDGRPFPPPGGEPSGVIDAGDDSLRFQLTNREGVSVLDLGRPLTGPGADRLMDALGEVLAGTTSHGGALLGTLGIAFVVAEDGNLPAGARARIAAQVDLDLVPATGLIIYRNASALPIASVLPVEADDRRLALASDPSETIRLRTDRAVPLVPAPGGWRGSFLPTAPSTGASPGLIVLATELDPDWRLEGSSEHPIQAFGWATAFDASPGPVRISHGGRLPRAIQTTLLVVLWLGALWVTRKPVAR